MGTRNETSEAGSETLLAQWLQEQMHRRGVGRNQVAEYSGVAEATISYILNNGHIPKPKTLAKLARWAGVDLITLLELAGVPTAADLNDLHPRARAFMRRLAELEPSLQEVATRTLLEGQLDAFEELQDRLEGQ